MTKPEYCSEEVYSSPPYGYTRCLWCTSTDMPLQCAKLNESEAVRDKEEEIMTNNQLQLVTWEQADRNGK